MPTLQTVVPQEIADAIEREATNRVPKDSVSRVMAEVLVPAFQERAEALRQQGEAAAQQEEASK